MYFWKKVDEMPTILYMDIGIKTDVSFKPVMTLVVLVEIMGNGNVII